MSFQPLTMEITKAVCCLKTILNHIEKRLECSFESIVGKNPESTQLIDDIVSDSGLQTFFQGKDDHELRKLHYLIFLNTDLKISSLLENECSIGHVVGVLPRLSSRIYLSLTQEYNLIKYMNEILRFSPLLMTIELLEIILSEGNLLPERQRFEVLSTVLQSVIVRLMKTDCESALEKISELFRMLMLCYKKFDNSVEETAKKSEEQIANEGFKFLSLISLAHGMIQDDTPACFSSPLYEIKFPRNSFNQHTKLELKLKSETIQECYENVLFRCHELLEELDLDMFLTWYEIKVEETNLQSLIGEKVFYLCRSLSEKQRENKLFTNVDELISMLKSISKTPVVIDTLTSRENDVNLIESILQNNTVDENFLEFLEHTLGNFSLKPHECFILLNKILDARTRLDIDPRRIDGIVILTLQAFETDELISLLRDFLTTCDSKHFLIERENDFNRLVEQINSLREEGGSYNEEQEETSMNDEEQIISRKVALMAFCATMTDLKSIIKRGCLERQKISVIVKIFKQLEPLCSFEIELKASGTSRPSSVLAHVFKSFLVDDYRNLTSPEKDKFHCLILELRNQQLLHTDDFLCVSLLPLLHVKNDSDWYLLADLLILFKNFFEAAYLESKLCLLPVILQVAQILENTRWSVATFSNERVLACERAIQGIDFLMELQSPNKITAPLCQSMEKKLNAYSFLTRSYFNRIFQQDLTSSIDLQLATLIHKSLMSYEKFTYNHSEYANTYRIKMAQIIMGCSSKEFLCIIENYAKSNYHRISFILSWMTDSIAFVSRAVQHFLQENEESFETTYSCLGYLINNFLNTLQKLNACYTGLEWIKHINRIIVVVREFPEHLIGTYQFNIVKFLVEELAKSERTIELSEDNVQKLLVENLELNQVFKKMKIRCVEMVFNSIKN